MALKRKSRPAPPRMSNLHDIQIKVSPRSPRATKATAVSNTETVAVSAAKSTQAPCGRPCVQSRPSRLNGMHGTCLGLNRPQEHESGPMVQTTDVRDYVHSYMQPCTQVQSKATLENSEQCLRTLMEPMICANTMRDIYIYIHTHTLWIQQANLIWRPFWVQDFPIRKNNTNFGGFFVRNAAFRVRYRRVFIWEWKVNTSPKPVPSVPGTQTAFVLIWNQLSFLCEDSMPPK